MNPTAGSHRLYVENDKLVSPRLRYKYILSDTFYLFGSIEARDGETADLFFL